MTRWFVHVDQPYYPSGQVVEAEDAESAVIAAWEKSGAGPGYHEDRITFAVFPFDQAELFGTPELVWSLVNGENEDYFKYRDEDEAEIPSRPLPAQVIDSIPPPGDDYLRRKGASK